MKKVKPAKKATPAKKVKDWPPPPPHPFGEDRGGRIERWKAIAAFNPEGPIGQIAALAIHAAEEGIDDDEIARRAVRALGLDGPKKTNGNTERLREALDEFHRAHTAAFPSPDEDADETPNVDADALERLKALCAEGLDLWLFRRVNGHNPVGDRPKQFLIRNARKGSDDLVRVLDWALRAAEPLTPRQRFSRGRKGS